jgi:hypothetical protein
MKPARFVRHARRRMIQRDITQEEVEEILRRPQRIESSVKGRQNAFGLTPKGLIRVTFRETLEEVIVITTVRQRSAGGADREDRV